MARTTQLTLVQTGSDDRMKAFTRSISLPMGKPVGQQERSAESESGLEIHPKNRTSTTVNGRSSTERPEELRTQKKPIYAGWAFFVVLELLAIA